MKLVLFSGGVDSTTCLAIAKNKDKDVIAISFDYGQRHREPEINAACEIAKYYKVEQKIIDLKNIFKDGNSSLTDLEKEVSHGDYNDQIENGESNTEVEFRNGVFISIMASLAMQYGADEIYFGAHMDDRGAIYPDCSPEFVESMKNAVKIGTSNKVELVVPFLNSTKTDIVKEGISLGVPYEMTYSCYEGTIPPCGVCGTCIDRKKAFLNNGLDID